jgi:hypothetical protein
MRIIRKKHNVWATCGFLLAFIGSAHSYSVPRTAGSTSAYNKTNSIPTVFHKISIKLW